MIDLGGKRGGKTRLIRIKAAVACLSTGAFPFIATPHLFSLSLSFCSIVTMRPASWSFWSVLLITLSVVSSFVFAGTYDEFLHLAYAFDSELMKDNVFPRMLLQVLRGRHHLPIPPFATAMVIESDEGEKVYNRLRPGLENSIIGALRASGDERRLIVLGAPHPFDASKKGYSIAIPVLASQDFPNNIMFGVVSIEHVSGRLPTARVRGLTVVTAPLLRDRLTSPVFPANDHDIIRKGHIVTTRELFAKLDQGMVGTPVPPPPPRFTRD